MDREVIDVDDLDVFCTGVRHCVRIDRRPSPRPKKRVRTVSLVDSDPDPPYMNDCTDLQRITQSELRLRTALLDPRPPKKRASDAIRMAMDALRNHGELKRKERRESITEVIEISSDSELENLPSKRQKMGDQLPLPYGADGPSGEIPKLEAEFARAEIHSSDLSDQEHDNDDDDDDDDYTNFLASLDISNEANWLPIPERNKAEDLTPMHEPDINVSKPPTVPPFRPPRKRPPVDHRHIPRDWLSVGPWVALSRHHGITRFPKPFYCARRQELLSPRRPPSLYYEKGYSKLELTARYPHLTSGSINKIIQKQGTVVLCAVVEAGLEDSDDEDDDRPPPPPPENKVGSLVVYRHGRVYIAPAHCHLRDTTGGPVTKYYTINDVVFNPVSSMQFLSSGHDLAIQTWEVLDPDHDSECKGLNAIRNFTLDSRPQDFVYASDGSALVISCNNGTIRLYSQDLFEDMADAHPSFKKFCVAPKGSGHAAGSTLWGEGPSKQLLFTSSEPTAKDDHSGYHHAFDTCKGVQAVQFDATEAGDAAALSPDGTTLGLFTWGKDNTHPVRLYDVARKAKEAYETEELEKFHARPPVGSNQGPGDSEEVNKASFSPDGRLLAVARSDNALHIYDIRALSRGPLCRFEHHDSDAVGGGGFGVVSAEWVQSRGRIGIMSGGNDGCVRLWEPALGSRDDVQGAVIGRTDFDVAHFSVGDRQNGELPLVIGDSGGGMQTYDHTNEEGTRI